MINVLLNLALIVTILLMPLDAYAYIDPGTGSMLLQAIIAIVAGALVIIKTYWQHIKKLFTKGKHVLPRNDRTDI